MKRVYVAGAGHVGLVTAVLIAQKGNFVSIYEKDERRRRSMASGKAPFFEPDLDEQLSNAIEAGLLEVVADPQRAVALSELSFVAVGTPTRKDGSVDLAALLTACRDFARGLRDSPRYHVLVIRSTVFPGTISDHVRKTVERFSDKRGVVTSDS